MKANYHSLLLKKASTVIGRIDESVSIPQSSESNGDTSSDHFTIDSSTIHHDDSSFISGSINLILRSEKS